MPDNEPKIVANAPEEPSKVLDISIELKKLLFAFGVSISLKYYNKNCECFSKWKKDELKGISSLIGKISQLEANKLRSGTRYCSAHKGPSKRERFQRPDWLSEDIVLYELEVTDKARMHGFFVDSVFFLLWLDREHECFKLD
jgi:hypothetical protein